MSPAWYLALVSHILDCGVQAGLDDLHGKHPSSAQHDSHCMPPGQDGLTAELC